MSYLIIKRLKVCDMWKNRIIDMENIERRDLAVARKHVFVFFVVKLVN